MLIRTCIVCHTQVYQAKGRCPILLDGNAGNEARDAIRSGQVHCLVWCSMGYEVPSSRDANPCSVAALCRTIKAAAEEDRPRVVFLVMRWVPPQSIHPRDAPSTGRMTQYYELTAQYLGPATVYTIRARI